MHRHYLLPLGAVIFLTHKKHVVGHNTYVEHNMENQRVVPVDNHGSFSINKLPVDIPF